MRAVALKQFEQKIGDYVHLAEEGETVLVTEQDRVVAELIPPRRNVVPWAPRSPLADAVQKGWIRPAVSAAGIPPRLPVAPLQNLLQDLQAGRAAETLTPGRAS